MGLADLTSVLKIFGGYQPTDAEKQALFRELLLMTLARASSADANIHPCEVDTVQRVLKEVMGDEISTADIRVAAASALYESAPLEDYLARCGANLDAVHRATVAQALARVIRSDNRVSPREIAFFDGVVRALEVSPAELMGLIAEGP